MAKVAIAAASVATTSRKTFKRQRVDRLLELRLDDPVIHRDAQLLEQIKKTYRRNVLQRGYRAGLQTHPALYCKYRGPRFPLRQHNGKSFPAWRTLSPWMKLQVGSLALAECGYMLFKVHLHDDLRAELEAAGRDQKDYLRDRLARCSRAQFGAGRWFFFVMEEHTTEGLPTRPHAHGSIELRPATLPRKGEAYHLRFRRLAERRGVEYAELLYGQLLTKQVLRIASGNLPLDRPRIALDVDQARNVWTTSPTRPLLNDQWVTYAFKNTKTFSTTLGDRRLAFSQSLRTESRKLWDLMRKGEPAISQWR